MGTLVAVAGAAYELFASLLAPPRCAACDAPVARTSAFCRSCAASAETVDDDPSAGVDGPRALARFAYGGPVAEAIVRMKYGGRPDLARPLGDLLYRAIAPYAGSLRGYSVVPVPLHPVRLAERGYNQSSLLARRVARHLGLRFDALALARTRDTPRQATLDRAARLTNVAASFRVRDPARIRGRAILLVDDVETTGATLAACSGALEAAGAAEVRTAVVARAR